MSWSVQSTGIVGEALAYADKTILDQIPSISNPVEQEHARDVQILLGKVLGSIPQSNIVNVSASGSTSGGSYWLKVSIEPKVIEQPASEKAAGVVKATLVK